MRMLLDTHIAIWAIADSTKLDDKLLSIIEDVNNEVYFSVASVWEVAIKHLINPGNMPISEEEFVYLCKKSGFLLLDILPKHIYMIKTLHHDGKGKKHNDPFDKLLISQAKSEELVLVTRDELIPGYQEQCVMKI